MWRDLVSTLITSIATLLGVFIGAKLSEHSASRTEKKRILAEFYAEVFSEYSYFVLKQNSECKIRLISACKKTRLLCSDESERILILLENAVFEDRPDSAVCGPLIGMLLKSAKKDMRHSYKRYR